MGPRDINIKGRDLYSFAVNGDVILVQNGLRGEVPYWKNTANFLVGCADSASVVCFDSKRLGEVRSKEGVTMFATKADCQNMQQEVVYLSAENFGYETGQELYNFIQSQLNPVAPVEIQTLFDASGATPSILERNTGRTYGGKPIYEAALKVSNFNNVGGDSLTHNLGIEDYLVVDISAATTQAAGSDQEPLYGFNNGGVFSYGALQTNGFDEIRTNTGYTFLFIYMQYTKE